MATELKLRKGTTAQHATFTGAVAEVTVDTDKDTLVVHDGVTAGGFPMLSSSVIGVTIQGYDADTTKNDVSNTFTTNQIVDANSSSPALRITQIGTGAALLVEDSSNPDASPFVVDASGKVGIGEDTPLVQLEINSTDAVLIPKGTTAQRPTGATAYFRYNTDLNKAELYNGTAWGSVGGGATGGGNDEVFVENSPTVTTDYTLSAGKNASSVGPITINSGVSVTVPDGARWVIL